MISRLRFIRTAALAAGVLAALPAGAGANVQVGSSGWQWGNPQPQGNTIRAMSFGGLRGYAAGDFGTLLQSEDGGTTWSGLPAGTHQNLTEVQAVDADTVVAGGGCVARRSDNGGLTFSRMAFTPVESSCKEGLQALFFPTEKIGYFALADGTVFRTPDGGAEFEQKSAVPGTRAQGGQASPASLWFTSETIGFAASTDGKIFQTKDSGNTWTLVNDTQRAVRDIAFADPTTGYAVGTDGLFLRTTDSGATWTAKASGSSEELTTVRCASLKLCVVTTASGTTLLRTENGGDSFTVVTPATDAIHAAAYASPTRLAAAGAAGTTVVSDDGGANFTPIGGRLVGKFLRIRAGLVPGSAFAPGDGGALGKTVDGGKTWTRGNVSTSEDVLDVSFPTVDEGYALDTAGGLFRTSTGGQSWKTLDTGTTARPNAVLATSAQNVLLVGPTGVRRSTDGGGTFEAVKGKAVSRTPLGAVDRAGSALVAYGSQRIIRSTDAGAHWTELRKPGKYVKRGRTLVNRLRVANVDFVDAKNGFALDGVGRLWKTRNAGRSWSELPGIGTEDAYGMAFSSTKAGYLVIYRFGDINQPSGFLLRTRDGGATWHPQFVVSTPIPAGGIAAPGGGVDYLLGGESALLSSTTGGDFGGESTLTVTTKRRSYKKPVRITVTGKLSPALGNERVTVSYRRPGSTGWASQTVKTAANGAYTTSWNLARGTNTFVAQWQGDFRSHGDGSPVLTVKVARRK